MMTAMGLELGALTNGDCPSLRISVAQTIVDAGIPDADAVSAAVGRVVKQLAEASEHGARAAFFPEGTIAYPSKRLMSRISPDLGEADWSRADWSALADGVRAIQSEAARRRIWVVVGGPHRLSEGRRPHNSLWVISDEGRIVGRYDKRFNSTNEAAYLYTPGTEPVVVEIDGVRVGFLLCLETLFPELFLEYAELGADVVHIASAPDRNFARLARAHALMTGLHVSVAFAASDDPTYGRSGICSMHGWVASAATTFPAVVVADVHPHRGTHEFQRKARSGDLYARLLARDDPRSTNRTSL